MKMVRNILLAAVAVLALCAVSSAAPQRPGFQRNPMRAVMHDMMEIGMMPLRLTIGAVQGGARMVDRGIVRPMVRGTRTMLRAPSNGFRSTFIN
ncbi:hypothetical protein FJT64_015394 [Amphibalanus amphitrite]|uniref:Uncharacterized protein n=1 Tax=Amphibalanus amphitrite TaxID=1232801 RepID=A0A6A4XGZ9_AMPAM|nr:hypothetical protein FJT64_015394 [Amphibalanus amphitrite]